MNIEQVEPQTPASPPINRCPDVQVSGLQALAAIIPLDMIAELDERRILSNSMTMTYKPGEPIFQQAQQDNFANFLLAGEVDILCDKKLVRTLRANMRRTADAIDGPGPKRHTAIARSHVRMLRVARAELQRVLETLNLTDNASAVHLSDVDDETATDWKSLLLQSPLFSRLQPQGLQSLFDKFERVAYEANDTVLLQGGLVEHLYILESGSAQKIRESADGATRTALGQLKVGDLFADTALITNEAQETNVVMDTDGSVVRLSRDNFHQLVEQPLLRCVTRDEADYLIKHDVRWLDLRSPSSAILYPLPHSTQVHAPLLKSRLCHLEPSHPYIVASDEVATSRAGAFSLLNAGFDCVYLDEGLKSELQY